jgi:hypothetical protein
VDNDAEMIRRRDALQVALANAGHTVHVDGNELRVETGQPGVTIDVSVVNIKDPQEESEVWITSSTPRGGWETTGVGQVRDQFVGVLVEGLLRFLRTGEG